MVAALLAGVAGVAGPAQAGVGKPPGPRPPASASAAELTAKAIGDCPREYACLWYWTYYEGTRWQGKNWNPYLPGTIKNLSESSFNNGVNCTVHWYDGEWYGSYLFSQARGVGYPNLYDLGYANRIESMNWC
ncbi:hypothetical protein L083_5539 [Actinoplanes sp. N902-109]|nr:hypothetical protein L083_5539 [Actinoplanes sp. N902-109]